MTNKQQTLRKFKRMAKGDERIVVLSMDKIIRQSPHIHRNRMYPVGPDGMRFMIELPKAISVKIKRLK